MTNNVVNFLYLLCGFAINEKFKTEIFMSENNGILYLRIIPPKIIALLLIDHKNVIRTGHVIHSQSAAWSRDVFM